MSLKWLPTKKIKANHCTKKIICLPFIIWTDMSLVCWWSVNTPSTSYGLNHINNHITKYNIPLPPPTGGRQEISTQDCGKFHPGFWKIPPRVGSTQAFGKFYPGFWKIPPRVLENCKIGTNRATILS